MDQAFRRVFDMFPIQSKKLEKDVDFINRI